MHLPCSCPFQLVTAAGDRPGGPGEQQKGCDGSGQGPCSLPSSYLCPQSPRVGPEVMLTPAVPWDKTQRGDPGQYPPWACSGYCCEE